MAIRRRIVNISKTNDYDIYIGRSSMYGNPFRVDIDGDRHAVIAMYKSWLLRWLDGNKLEIINGHSNKYICEHLHRLKGKILGCHCAPSACHGDILEELTNRR